jgi:hypothetical protein
MNNILVHPSRDIERVGDLYARGDQIPSLSQSLHFTEPNSYRLFWNSINHSMRNLASTPSIPTFASSPILQPNHLHFLTINPPLSSPSSNFSLSPYSLLFISCSFLTTFLYSTGKSTSIQCSVQFRPCIDIHKVTYPHHPFSQFQN